MRTTIHIRIALISIAVLVMQALCVGTFALYTHNKSQKRLVHEQLQATNKTIQAQISIFFTTILHDLELSSCEIEQTTTEHLLQLSLSQSLKSHKEIFSALAFYDSNGTLKKAVSNAHDGNITHWFARNIALYNAPARSNTPFITKITLANGTLALGISLPVFHHDTPNIQGVIAALVPFEALQETVYKTPLPPNQNLLILDNEGVVIAQKSQNNKTHPAFPSDQNWDGELMMNHTRFISASSSATFHGQQFIVVANIDASTASGYTSRSYVLLSCLIVLLLFMCFLIWLLTHKKIIKPLQQLAQDSKEMVPGKEIHITPAPDTEIQILTDSLNRLNQQLLNANYSHKKEVRHRRREEKLAILAKIDAEKANQAKSIYLANMSHEIRTPLQGVIAMLKMLEEDPLTPKQQHLLSMMVVSGQRLQAVVNSILDLSQIESGKFKLHHSPFRLSELITEVVDLMQIHVINQKKDITINSEQSTEIPDALIGDSGRIRQILINLLSNSIKFSETGRIELSIQLNSTPNDREIELLFSVEDSGQGIPEEDVNTIFNAFARGSQDTDVLVEGVGLGLAISAEFVQHMHGKLWLENTTADGSTFCFTILCTLAVDETHPEATKDLNSTTEKKRLDGIRLFLAEDEFINQRLISACLEEEGGTVTVCANGQELLDTMETEVGDIILMDIRMPVLDGLKTTEIIRAQEIDSALLPIPIVALTAQASSDFEKQCKDAGMDAYLTKPIPLDKLIDIVCDLVRKG